MFVEHGFPSLAPDAPEDGSGEQPALLSGEQEVAGLELVTRYELAQDRDERRMGGHWTGIANGPALQMTALVDLAVVRPLAADLGLRRVGKQLTPAVLRERRISDAEGDGLLRAQARVIEGGEEGAEPVSGTGRPPIQSRSRATWAVLSSERLSIASAVLGAAPSSLPLGSGLT